MLNEFAMFDFYNLCFNIADLAETSPSKPRRFLYSGTRPDLQAQLVENKKENVGRAAAQPNGTLEGQKPTIHLQTLPELSISKVSFEPANNLKNR